jgi:hypothetical protein
MKSRIKVLTLGVDDLDRSFAFYRGGRVHRQGQIFNI